MSFLDKETLKVVGTRPIRPDGVDKVTGRANFGADMVMPGMLWGKIKRSPHAHARILSINTDKAMALPGVKAVTTRADFPDIPPDKRVLGAAPANLWDLSRNCMAIGKALYEGHAVAAVAAISPAIAEQALDLIEVEYEVLPHVMDVEAAMAPDAPLLHDNIFTAGVDPKPTKPSNISKVVRFAKGDVEAGFREAEIVIERRYTTKPVHQGYIEPHACVVSVAPDGQTTIWSSSQGQFMVRGYTSRIVGADIANIRAIPAEIGGGFGGKTIVYLEPVAYMLSKKSGRPVKIVMSREEVFRATGPTSGAVVEVKLGAKKDGHITAAKTVLKYQSGAFPGSPVQQGCICGLAVYDLPNAETVGYDVLCNRPKVAAYRAPGAPIGSFAVESCMDELARELKIDPLRLREMNGAKDGTKATHGPTWVNIGYQQTLEAAKAHEHLKTRLGPNQGRGIASGYWHNAGGEFERGLPRQRGRHRHGDRGASRYRRLARLDGDDGCRSAGRSIRERAPGRRRHDGDRLQRFDRWQPRHICRRHGGDAIRAEGRRRTQEARRGDVGHQPRGGRVAGRQGVPRRRQCRQLRTAALG